MNFRIRVAKKKDGKIVYNHIVNFYTEWAEKYKNSKFKRFALMQRPVIKKGLELKKEINKFEKRFSKLSNSKDEIFFVLEDEKTKKIVGYIIGYIKERDVHWRVRGCLDELYVLPEFRGNGGGSLLIDTTLKWLKKNGAKSFELEVELINPKAIKLYEKYGFETTMYKMQKKL